MCVVSSIGHVISWSTELVRVVNSLITGGKVGEETVKDASDRGGAEIGEGEEKIG